MVKQREWDVQQPLTGTDVRRLLTVTIPHRSLGLPPNFAGTDPETVLIPPPVEGQQLEVDVLVEPGPVPNSQWPGLQSLGTRLVGRVTLYRESPDDGLLNFTLVWTVREEDEATRPIAEAEFRLPDGSPAPDTLRAVVFGTVEVDGQFLPVLTEMPVGHLRDE